MSDVATEDKAFDEGFTPEAPPSVVTPKEEPKVEATVEAKAEPAPEYVQITRDQLGRFVSAADETVGLKAKQASLEAQIHKVGGLTGNLKQVIEKLQAETPAGAAVDLSDDDFADLAADFPELAKHTRAGLEKIFKRLNVRGTGEQTVAAPDPDAMQKAVEAVVNQRQIKELAEAYPNWSEIVGAYGDATNEFRQWLGKQPEPYQKRLNETQSAFVIEQALDRFHAAKTAVETKPTPPAARVVARQDRIRDAIQPRGDGGQPSPKPSADPFDEGFRA